MRFEGDRDNPARDVRRSDFRRLDIRLAVWLAAYAPLTAGGMVAGDFSTALEMTGVGEI